MTGSVWFNLGPTGILALEDLDTKLKDTVQDELSAVRFEIYGGDGTIGSAKASFTYAASKISLAADALGITGDGQSITIDSSDAAFTSVPFINTAATTYRIGCRRNFYPSAVSANSIDRRPVYTELTEDVGEIGTPNLVTDTGTGLAFRIDTLAKHIWTVGGGASRPVKIWLVDPVTGVTADAIVSGTAVAASSHVVVTITGYLGQAAGSVSLTAADYQILLRGPTITTTDLSADANYWLIGTITDNVFTSAAASLFPAYGTWTTTFQVQHTFADGKHSTVTADEYGFNTTRTIRIDLGSYCIGSVSWDPTVAANWQSAATTSSAGTITARHTRPNSLLVIGAGTQLPLPGRSSGTTWTIKGWEMLVLRAAAATTLDVALIKKDKAGVIADSTLDTWSVPSTASTGTLHLETHTGLTFVVDPGYLYIVTVVANCAASTAEIEWHNLALIVEQSRVP